MLKHTPGPWTPSIYETTPSMLERLKFKQWSVCRNENKDKPTGTLVALCGDINTETELDRENSLQSLADAHLIAAAPDLYSSLMNITNAIKLGLVVSDEDLAEADHALDKARGATL